MIEWIIGAALLASGLRGFGNKKDSDATRVRPISTDHNNGVSNYATKIAEWRILWEKEINYSQWIPKSMASRIIERFPPPQSYFEAKFKLGNINLLESLNIEFAAHNVAHLAKQKTSLKSFFETIEKNPLTDEQMDGCICMDDAVLIVAAAGSGKTSTMVAKAGYALQESLAKPEQILLLAFNSDAATELNSRIKDRLAGFENIDAITAKTFHAFGYDVIAKSTGRKPSLAPWVESPGQDVRMVAMIINDLRDGDLKFRNDWDLFRTVFGRDIGQWSKAASTYSNGPQRILTANGDVVKSEEERMIADWLFYHGVRYQYESKYEYDTATAQYSQYKPDFFYPDIQLYHEHLALNRAGLPPEHFKGDYLAGVRWKRELHAKNDTALFETTSHEIRGNSGFVRLANELERHGVALQFNAERTAPGQAPVTIEQLASTIRTFQQHVKGNGLTHQQLRHAVQSASSEHTDRMTRFLYIYKRIADEWERKLREIDCIDFDDMLLAAISHIENGTFISPYTMILADEFQDSSRARVRLLNALRKNAGEQSHLCVVGDDWQGINRFAGADISVMTEFIKIFEHSTQLTLSTTFRCPAPLCEASSNFIQTNPRQIKKTVVTTNTFAKPALFAYAAETQDHALSELDQVLRTMHALATRGRLSAGNGDHIHIMLLGRYHHDKPKALQRWQRQFSDFFKIEFRTMHAAKGLEADYIMILNIIDGILGFPSQITDDPLLQIAMPEPDSFPMAEERRLFYVALTRARRQVRIYTSITSPSRFLIELAKAGSLEIETNAGTLQLCPKCSEGTLRRQDGKYGPFEFCSTNPRCDFKRNIIGASSTVAGATSRTRIKVRMSPGDKCPSCNNGSMVVRAGGPYKPFLACSGYPTCMTTAALADGGQASNE